MAETAVVEKVSGQGGGGPVLKGDTFKEFASAVAGQTPETESAPAPEVAAPSDTPAEEPAPSEEPAAPPPAAPTSKAPAPEDTKGPIPYDRFREVNEQLRVERQKLAEYEQKKVAEITERANAQSAQLLFKIAEENPELAPLIFRGERPQPKAAPVDPNAPALTPDQKAIRELQSQNSQLMGWKQKQEQAAVLQGIQDRAEGQMDKHPIFKNDRIREISEEIIVKRILTQPQIAPEIIVDQVAQGFKDLEASIKETYLGKKKEAARTVAPGVGSGSPPAPPAHPPKKLKLSDGTALRAMQAAMSAMSHE